MTVYPKHLKYQIKLSSIFPLHLQKGKKNNTHGPLQTNITETAFYIGCLLSLVLRYCTNDQTIALSRDNSFIKKKLIAKKKKCIWLSWNSQNAHDLLQTLITANHFEAMCCQRRTKKKKISKFRVRCVKMSLMPLYFERGRPMTG